MAYDPERITFFAETDARGQHVRFGIKAKDRTRHVYVIGKTGMGKSTMLENMAIQDIQNGEGLAFIDPHGSTAETLLDYIPEHRIRDVLYFAPFDMEQPVSFNIMEDVGADKRHLVVSGLMSVFEKIWVDMWSARMEYILSNTLLALLEYPGSTLLGVNRMLSDKDYRKLVVDNIKDPSVKSFWVDEFAKYNERYMQEAGDSIKNKIGQFTGNPLIRNIIGQPRSSFDIRKIMDEKKILIMNLSKGLVGETNANLLGSMLTTRIYLAAMSRADLSQHQMQQMPNFYFYVDEFQSFANATFANILSEARKYKLNLTIAHQYIEQMEEDVRNAVFGNVGTTIAFRVGPFDAEVLETIFAPKFMATDIVNLGFAQIYLTLMIDGIGSTPFSAVTLPPLSPPSTSYKDMVIAASREQYSRPRADIEADILKFHEPIKKPSDERNGGSGGAPRSNGNGTPRGNGQNGRSAPQERSKTPRENRREDRQTPAHEPPAARIVSDNVPQREQRRERDQQRAPSQNRPNRGPQGRPKEKSLEDLRAVLRSISGNDMPSKKKTEDQKEQKEPSRTPVNKAELKSALGDVLKSTKPQPAPVNPVGATAHTTPDRPQSPQQQEDPRRTQDPSPTTSEPARDATPPVQQPVAVHNDMPETVPPTDERDVSAKELERMMRVTTNDKPPM